MWTVMDKLGWVVHTVYLYLLGISDCADLYDHKRFPRNLRVLIRLDLKLTGNMSMKPCSESNQLL